jgi:hypothetical protein
MNLNHYTTNDYKNNSSPLTMENQTQSNPNKLEANLAEIPTGELLGILKPGTNQTQSQRQDGKNPSGCLFSDKK